MHVRNLYCCPCAQGNGQSRKDLSRSLRLVEQYLAVVTRVAIATANILGKQSPFSIWRGTELFVREKLVATFSVGRETDSTSIV